MFFETVRVRTSAARDVRSPDEQNLHRSSWRGIIVPQLAHRPAGFFLGFAESTTGLQT
jgi:hypothetical protein